MSETIGQAPQEAPVTTAPIAESGDIGKTLQSIARLGKPGDRAMAIRGLPQLIADKLNPLKQAFNPMYDQYSALIEQKIMLAIYSGRIPKGQNLGPVELGEQFHQTLKKAGLNPKDPNLPLNTLAEAFLESVMPARPAVVKQKAESPAPKTTETKIDEAQPQETPATEPTRQEAGATQQPESVRAQATKGLLSGIPEKVKKGAVKFFSRFKKGKPQEQPQQPPGPTQEQTATAVEQVPTDLVTTAQQTPEETVPPAAPAEEPTAHIETIAQPLEVAPAAEEKRQTEEAPAAGVPAEPEITTPTMSKDEAQTDIAGEPPAAAPEAPITEGQKTDEQRAEARESRQEPPQLAEPDRIVPIIEPIETKGDIRETEFGIKDIFEITGYGLDSLPNQEKDKILLLIKSIDKNHPEKLGQFFIHLDLNPKAFFTLDWRIHDLFSEEVKSLIQEKLTSLKKRFSENSNSILEDPLILLRSSWIGFKSFFGKEGKAHIWSDMPTLIEEKMPGFFEQLKQKMRDNPTSVLTMTDDAIQIFFPEQQHDPIRESIRNLSKEQVRDFLEADPLNPLRINYKVYEALDPEAQKLVDLATYRIKIKSE